MLREIDGLIERERENKLTASRAAILVCAVPLPPEMMAPAWPILRPGGAVTPAMKDTTGLASGPYNKMNQP